MWVRRDASWQKHCANEVLFVVGGPFLGYCFNDVSHNASTGEDPSFENRKPKMLHNLKLLKPRTRHQKASDLGAFHSVQL